MIICLSKVSFSYYFCRRTRKFLVNTTANNLPFLTNLYQFTAYPLTSSTDFPKLLVASSYLQQPLTRLLITNSIQGGITTTQSQTNTSEEFKIYPPRYSKDNFKRDFSLDDQDQDLNFGATADENYSSPPVYPSEYQTSSSDFRKNYSELQPNRFKSWRKYNLEDYIYVGDVSKHSRDQLIIFLD